MYAIITASISSLVFKQLEIQGEDGITPRTRVKQLRARFARTKEMDEEEIREAYQRVLLTSSSTNPREWYDRWFDVFVWAKVAGIPDISGDLGKKAFLKAVNPMIPSFVDKWITHLDVIYSQGYDEDDDDNTKLYNPTLEKLGALFVIECDRRGITAGKRFRAINTAATLGNKRSNSKGRPNESTTGCICRRPHA